MPSARLAQTADLIPLLDLYRVSDVSAHVEPIERAEQIWQDTLASNNIAVFVSTADARIVASCMLISAPNLLRSGKSHAVLENVVTHPEFQGRGHGRAVVEAGLRKHGQGIAITC